MNDLNQVSSLSLLIASSTAHAKEGLFELTQHPLLTRAVSSSFAETTEEPGCSQVKTLKFVASQLKKPLLTRAVEEVMSKETDET